MIPLNQCMMKNINSKQNKCNCCETNSENNGKCNCCDLSNTPTTIINSPAVTYKNSSKDCPLDLSCCNKTECVRLCNLTNFSKDDCCSPRCEAKSKTPSNLLAKASFDICLCPPGKCKENSACCNNCPGRVLNIC